MRDPGSKAPNPCQCSELPSESLLKKTLDSATLDGVTSSVSQTWQPSLKIFKIHSSPALELDMRKIATPVTEGISLATHQSIKNGT